MTNFALGVAAALISVAAGVTAYHDQVTAALVGPRPYLANIVVEGDCVSDLLTGRSEADSATMQPCRLRAAN